MVTARGSYASGTFDGSRSVEERSQASFLVGPTAASVTVSGRVLTSSKRGLMNAIVSLMDQSGNVRTTRTTTFGYYRFDEVAVGGTYVLMVHPKRYTYAPIAIVVTEEIVDLDFYPIDFERKE